MLHGYHESALSFSFAILEARSKLYSPGDVKDWSELGALLDETYIIYHPRPVPLALYRG
jgi:hypothetical protein